MQSFALPGAQANPAGTGLVISEVYGGGGNGGATYTHDFVELFNPTGGPLSLNGLAVQYRSSGGNAPSGTTPLALSGSVAAGGSYLIQMATNAAVGSALPTPDATGSYAMSGASGQVLLTSGTAPFTGSGNVAGNPAVVDMVGYGTGNNTFEGQTEGTALSATTSAQRAANGADTDNNAPDFAVATPAPQNSGGQPDPEPEPEPTGPVTIAEIQGPGAASPLLGRTVETTGIVTAAYPSGGLFGFYLQTPGTGGPSNNAARTTSDAVFVRQTTAAGAVTVEPGDYVRVRGTVSEFAGQTQVEVASTADISDVAGTPTPVLTTTTATWPSTSAQKEALEGMRYRPSGDFTITNNFSANTFGELGLAQGDSPLIQPTEEALPGSTEAAAIAADNAARAIVLDDGSSTNFGARTDGRLVNGNQTPPYISDTAPFRVGATGRFDEDVIFTEGGSPTASTYRFVPLTRVMGDGTGAPGPATFPNTRTDAPVEAQISADGTPQLKVASFNVLNYFTSLGDVDDDGTGDAGCTTSNLDNDGDGNTVAGGCDFRGAWDPADFNRQQSKIVSAINALDADVVGLMEIENSFSLGETPDEATQSLVTALNAAAGPGTWAANPSSEELPEGGMDVISNAIIYKPSAVTRLGESRALGTLSDNGEAFGNAREPLAQAFTPSGGGDPFMVAVNHFKSKSATGSSGDNRDLGQGAWNADRTEQAEALAAWVPTVQGDVEDVLLLGDFNSYSQEDPMQVLYEDGYENLAAEGDYSYSFDGLSGSLDHILANPSALERFTGSDVWNINGGEPVSLEYSRFNTHATNFHTAKPFRSSDHDPIVVGLGAGTAQAPSDTVDVNLLNINDFHGRIDANTTKFATTIEQLKAQEGDANSLFLSAGDNIGASLFPSASQDDNPTLDILDALGLKTSAVGNHEFDRGFDDLRGRVQDRADFTYLGANVYRAGTQTPVLDEYDVFEVDGVSVAVIGAVTQLTPELVSPAGTAGLEFGDPVAAVNRVAARLSDGIQTRNNDEADVIVAEYHEGASAGTPDGSTPEAEIAAGGAFADIATETSSEVDAIFTGHTHKQYAWDIAVPGEPTRTRPVLQTGSYGENIGQIVLTVDATTGDVASYTQRNVARAAAEDLSFPRVAEVKRITDAALASAAVIGNRPVGRITADITTAYTFPAEGPRRDNRTAESTLGGVVANALRDGVSEFAEPDLGITNPGGLRAELLFAGDTSSNPANADGVVTFAEANAVLPFNNTVAVVQLSGAELKAVMEQQWRTGGYLQLGLSSNVRVTADASAPQGSRITSVSIDDEPLDLTREYTISTLSFLATGGDAFTAFRDGTFVDTGLLDAQLWRDYLAANAPVSPEFSRQQVFATGLPTAVVAGQATSFTLGTNLAAPTLPNTGETLDLTSLGSPANTAVVVYLDNGTDSVRIGEFPVTNGTAEVSFTAPSNLVGPYQVAAFSEPTGTYVGVPLSEKLAATVSATASPQTAGRPGTVTAVVSSDGAPTGSVVVSNGDTVLGTGTVSQGTAVVGIDGGALPVGTYTLTATYSGDAASTTATSTLTYVVVEPVPTTVTAPDQAVAPGQAVRVQIQVTGSSTGPVPAGIVEVLDGVGSLGTARVGADGSATVTLAAGSLPVGARELTLRYAGEAPYGDSEGSFTLTVTGAPTAPPVPPTTPPAPVTPKPEVSPKVKGKVVVGRTRAFLVAKIRTATGAKATGQVKVKVKGQKNQTVRIKNGKVKLRLGVYDTVGKKKVVFVYLGNATTPRSKERITINVVGR